MSRYRSHTCGELRPTDAGNDVVLSGWVHNRRDHGGVLFIDLRDNYGLTQLVVRNDSPYFAELQSMQRESVLRVEGRVLARDSGNVNKDLTTGSIEVEVAEVEVLSTSAPLPFPLHLAAEKPGEDSRLQYRFLDLRRQEMHDNIHLRSAVISRLRTLMTQEGFFDLQTPILSATSPEGARDFLVPSRLHPGKFYALPQAPQQWKQLYMMAGFDRYFQIAPCFRDEDSRADRSPGEFYQLDMEMSFAEQSDVFQVIERVLTTVFQEFSEGRQITSPYPHIAYRDSMLRYGSDKPDLRSTLELTDVTDVFSDTAFRAFAGKHVRALAVPGCAGQPRSFFDQMEALAVENGAKGLAWLRVGEDGVTLTGSIAKFLSDTERQDLVKLLDGQPGTAFFLGAGDYEQIGAAMAPVRVEAAKRTDQFDENAFKFCWIVDFPMYEKADDGSIQFSHNPFSMPQGELEALETKDPLDILAWQYDIVCNGIELSSGAVRNHRPDIMLKAFEIAGYPAAEVEARFGGMFKALHYGAPPHAGIAPGVDRIVMMLANQPNIREIIAWPLNQNGLDRMMGAPSAATPAQMKELQLRSSAPPVAGRLVPGAGGGGAGSPGAVNGR